MRTTVEVMTQVSSPSRAVSIVVRAMSSALGLMMLIVALLWLVELADNIVFGGRLQTGGIHPRRLDGLDGILWTPLLHSSWGHVTSNTVPFVALGWLVALRGRRYWLTITAATIVIGGALTWLLAGGTNHIGASGVVFGYFGALLGGAWVDRRPATLAPAAVALFLYSGMLAGLVPQDAISWEGHLFGFIAGLLVARRVITPSPRRLGPVDEPEAWEAEQPWLGPGQTDQP